VAHGVHVAPFTPHAAFVDITHWPLWQQPLQLAWPQEHAPFEHVWPMAQVPHALPAEPHALVDCDAIRMQAPVASQQPPGHEAGVHTHLPADPHVWPVAHPVHAAAPVPQALADWLA
jgi:hypothetical protein